MRRGLGHLVLVVVACGGWPAVGSAAFLIQPDHLYQTSDAGVRQFSADLRLQETVAPPQLAGFLGTVGSGISPDGRYYLFCGYLRPPYGTVESGPRLFVLDAAGNYVRDVPVASGLNRTSHIAFDRSGRAYVASGTALLEFTPDLTQYRGLPPSFGRVAGLAFDAQDRLFVADQDRNQIVLLDPQRQAVVNTFPTGRVPMGIDFAPDGSLYYTDTPFQTPTGYIGRLVRLDPATGQQTVIFDDLRLATDVEFLRDGSFYLALDLGGMIRRYDASFTPRELFSDGTAGDTINFLEPHEVPEPHAAACLAVGAGGLLLRRRKR